MYFAISQAIAHDECRPGLYREYGNVMEIAEKFGGSQKLVEAVHQLQTLLYAA
jgi:hypothetical protein